MIDLDKDTIDTADDFGVSTIISYSFLSVEARHGGYFKSTTCIRIKVCQLMIMHHESCFATSSTTTPALVSFVLFTNKATLVCDRNANLQQ